MQVSTTSSSFLRAGVVAVAVWALWVATVSVSAMPPVFPLGPQPIYVNTDAAALVAIEPVLHAPWVATTARPLALLMAAVVLIGASGVAIFSGAAALATGLVLLALALDASFSAALGHAAPSAIAAGLVWLAAGAAFDREPRFARGQSWFNPLSALVLWALAVWCSWLAVIAWPIVWAALRRAPDRPGRGWWTLASIVAGLAALIGHFSWVATTAGGLTMITGPVPGWREAMAVAFETRSRLPSDSFAAPDLTARVGSLLVALAAIGLTFASLERWWRRTVIACGALVLAVMLLWPVWQMDVLRFAGWLIAPMAAVGLTWVAREGRRPLAVTLLVGAVALAQAVVSGYRPMDGVDARTFRDALSAALEGQAAAAPLAVAAEDTRIDSALMSWLSARAPRALRVPQDAALVKRAMAEGRTVLAGPTARRHLELSGLAFDEAFAITDPAPYEMSAARHALQCVTVRADRWSQLPGLEYTGRLGLHVPPRAGGALHVIVGDSLPLALRGEDVDGRSLELRAEPLSSGLGASPPPADYWIDAGAADAASHTIRRLRFPAQATQPVLLSLHLGRRAPKAIARLVGYPDDARGAVCAAAIGRAYLGDEMAATLPLASEANFANGWYGREGQGREAFRWASTEAIVLMRSSVRADVTVTLLAGAARPSDATGETTVTLVVNGVDAGTRVMRDGDAPYAWQVPAGVWVVGTNELWWRTSRAVRPADAGGTDARVLALRVKGIAVTRAPA